MAILNSSLKVVCTPFTTTDPNNQHISTDWIIKDTNNNILYNNLGDTVNLTSLTINEPSFLDYDKEYRVEVKYNGSTLSSNYSFDLALSPNNNDYLGVGIPNFLLTITNDLLAVNTTILQLTSFNSPSGETHLSTDWRFLDENDNLIFESLNDTVNLTSYDISSITSLTQHKKYTLYVRYNGTNNFSLSNILSIVTDTQTGFLISSLNNLERIEKTNRPNFFIDGLLEDNNLYLTDHYFKIRDPSASDPNAILHTIHTSFVQNLSNKYLYSLEEKSSSGQKQYNYGRGKTYDIELSYIDSNGSSVSFTNNSLNISQFYFYTPKPLDIPLKDYGYCYDSVRNNLFIAGGINVSNNTYNTDLIKIDLETGNKTIIGTIPKNLLKPSLTLIVDKNRTVENYNVLDIIIAGGKDENNFENDIVYKFNINNNTLTELTRTPYLFKSLKIVADNINIFFVGETNNSYFVTMCFDLFLNKWNILDKNSITLLNSDKLNYDLVLDSSSFCIFYFKETTGGNSGIYLRYFYTTNNEKYINLTNYGLSPLIEVPTTSLISSNPDYQLFINKIENIEVDSYVVILQDKVNNKLRFKGLWNYTQGSVFAFSGQESEFIYPSNIEITSISCRNYIENKNIDLIIHGYDTINNNPYCQSVFVGYDYSNDGLFKSNNSHVRRRNYLIDGISSSNTNNDNKLIISTNEVKDLTTNTVTQDQVLFVDLNNEDNDSIQPLPINTNKTKFSLITLEQSNTNYYILTDSSDGKIYKASFGGTFSNVGTHSFNNPISITFNKNLNKTYAIGNNNVYEVIEDNTNGLVFNSLFSVTISNACICSNDVFNNIAIVLEGNTNDITTSTSFTLHKVDFVNNNSSIILNNININTTIQPYVFMDSKDFCFIIDDKKVYTIDLNTNTLITNTLNDNINFNVIDSIKYIDRYRYKLLINCRLDANINNEIYVNEFTSN